MNPTNNPIPTAPPIPVLRDYHLIASNGDPMIWENEYQSSEVNLTTGVIRYARVLDRIRYDTQQATLVAGWARLRNFPGGYRIQRLYRGHHGRFFVIAVDWHGHSTPFSGIALAPVPDSDVLLAAQHMVGDDDAFVFLRDWYLGGWLPREDAAVQSWAERVLSAGDCEWLMSEMQQRAWPLPRVEGDW